MKMALGSLDRVDTVLKMLCMVNAVPDFKDHPKGAAGMSNLFVEVFGDAGRHARSAVGMGSLPNQISVEIEVIMAGKSCTRSMDRGTPMPHATMQTGRIPMMKPLRHRRFFNTCACCGEPPSRR